MRFTVYADSIYLDDRRPHNRAAADRGRAGRTLNETEKVHENGI